LNKKFSGTFVVYDPAKKPKAPRFNGVLGGVSYNDHVSKQYVGYGTLTTEEKYYNIPCYISTEKDVAGCYEDTFDNYVTKDTAKYLLSHPNLTWIRNDLNNLRNAQSALEITSTKHGITSDRYLFGRMKMDDDGQYHFGKVYAHEKDKFKFELNYIEGNTYMHYNKQFEVLACAPIVDAPCGKHYPQNTYC
jgi:hypothetical protein